MIQEDEVRHMAKLARLQLEDQEVALYTEQLDGILGFFDELKGIDTEGVPLTSHPVPVSNAFRADVVRPSLPLEQVLLNAPKSEGDYFRVPRILET
jgi:aspartyl-tRNA(Asn)/glutamyl-tRNA(Gln) amidotransferase subunit C